MNGYGVPFLSHYMLVLLIDLHKQLLFPAGVDPARSFSDIFGHLIDDSTFTVYSTLVTYLVNARNPG